ncbi:unnamed protein product [Spirodela intermedia]|uniref:Nucleoporin Nup133/Nup155-like N-terminal domain-containing protein n=1 Tax=Spirodela intermedia TaxID=51605 RepID=A0A7I8JCU8_SPIIN|nr:unnamed protein product [Spirodela intermedia]CAA6667343.1 unnamed protein product [Spirodela intermedia]
MFTPATKKSHFPHRRGTSQGREAPDSPTTPIAESRPSVGLVASRPATGTPAPWGSRLSDSITNKNIQGAGADQTQPVFVADFPRVVRSAQALQKNTAEFRGGIDEGLSLSWIVCGNQLFIWSFLLAPSSKKCVVLDIPSLALADCENDTNLNKGHWLICFVDWSKACEGTEKVLGRSLSAGVVACHQETGVVIYWPDIFSESENQPVVSLPSHVKRDGATPLYQEVIETERNKEPNQIGDDFRSEENALTLWRFFCSSTKIYRERVSRVSSALQNNETDQSPNLVYARSLVWRFQHETSGKSDRQFFLLTDHEIQCWNVLLAGSGYVTKLWSHEIAGTDGDVGIKKDLCRQDRIWLLDMQVDNSGSKFKVLVATLCKDQVSSSSYIQYSLLTLQYTLTNDRILEKKGPLHVLIPKGRVEDEKFLLSIRLRIGGKPPGSAVILSGKGTATVASHWRGTAQLCQFELPWDAGKVLDASVITSLENVEEGAWVVLTEKAGIWAIPEKAVLHGIFSQKGSPNKEDTEEEERTALDGDIGDRQRALVSTITQHTAQDEEAEGLLGSLFHNFLLTGKVEGAFEKLKKNRAFEKEGAMNVFARMSRSIVDTLAKHWTTTRGADFLSSAVVSSQLLDKQQKHKRFLQFLALSKCHEELSSRQRHSLQTILEHGEKLCAMIQLRELQSQVTKKRSGGNDSPSSLSMTEATSSLWISFNYRVSDLEELFYCLSHNLHYIIDREHSMIQIQRTCEISNACTRLAHWNCGPVVRSGLWNIASLIIKLLKEAPVIDKSVKFDLSSHLEGLSDVLLEAYNASVTVKMERGEEYKVLLEEYCKRRDEILYLLIVLSLSLTFTLCTFQEICRGTQDPDLKRSIFKEASGHLLTIAKQHEGYQTLWDICFDLNSTELLRNLMDWPQGGFSYFVFKQLYRQQRYSTLLRLGEEFQEELLIFLRQHKELLWLHEIFLNKFSSASENLHALGLSQDNASSLMAEESFDPDYLKPELSLSDRRRFLNLSKIAAAVDKDVDFDAKIQRLEADLHLLKLQEKITGQLQDGEDRQQFSNLLHPGKLIELCLKSQTQILSLEAFEVFAWTSSSFRSSNRSLLVDCWMNAADQDDWSDIYQSSVAEGWTDEAILQILKGTVLFQASQRCYGPQAEVYDGGFDEVLPLLKEDVEPTSFKDPGISVEAILMQHKGFLDAGKLMVTAIVMGKLGAGAVSEGDLMAEL